MPKASSFGQAAVFKDGQRTWKATQNFLKALTIDCTVEAYLYVSNVQYLYLEEKVCLGPWRDGRFIIAEAQIFDVISLLEQPQGLVLLKDVRLTITIGFAWAVLTTAATFCVEPLQMQAERCLLVSTWEKGRRMFFQPRFVFLVPWFEPLFAILLGQLRVLLPFKLRPACFYQLLAKSGHAGKVDYHGRNLPPQAMNLIHTCLS